MLQFEPAGIKWWNKPLVKYRGQDLPAELAVLQIDLEPEEAGVWLNSGSIKTGVTDLVKMETAGQVNTYRTLKVDIPDLVSNAIRMLYKVSRLSEGCPDLVIWNESTQVFRFARVKCPHWDQVSKEQMGFMKVAKKYGIKCKVVDWELARP